MGFENQKVRKAVILAGGMGTRLEKYSQLLPKPLMPVGDKPILEILLAQLKKAQIDEVVITVGHLAHLIETYFGNGEAFNSNINYSREDRPLGTAGPLSLIEGLDETFLVCNGDIFCNMNLSDLIKYHNKSGALATISSYVKKVKVELGVMKVDDHNQVIDYIEKPEYDYLVSMGVYVFDPKVLEYIPNNEYFDFPDLVLKLIKNSKKVVSFPFSGIWRDLGRPGDYEEANKIFAERRDEFLPK